MNVRHEVTASAVAADFPPQLKAALLDESR